MYFTGEHYPERQGLEASTVQHPPINEYKIEQQEKPTAVSKSE